MKHRNLIAVIKNFVIFLLIYILLSFTVVMLIYEGLFTRREAYEYNLFISKEEIEQEYSSSEITFESRGFPVSAVIYGDNKDKLVILGHAKDGSSNDMTPEAYFFLKKGFSVLTMDFTGHGSSGGTSQFGLQQCVFDMENAISFVRSEGYEELYIYGIGIGGYAAAACADEEGVSGVAAISAFSSISDLTLEYATQKMSVLGYLEYPVMMLYQFMVYGSDINNSAVSGINSSDVPVIIINGTNDDKIKFDGAALINAKDKITSDKVIYRAVEGGFHLSLMRTEDAINHINEFNEKAYELYNEYGSSVPTSDIENLYDSVDSVALSELDEGLMNEILAVFGCE